MSPDAISPSRWMSCLRHLLHQSVGCRPTDCHHRSTVAAPIGSPEIPCYLTVLLATPVPSAVLIHSDHRIRVAPIVSLPNTNAVHISDVLSFHFSFFGFLAFCHPSHIFSCLVISILVLTFIPMIKNADDVTVEGFMLERYGVSHRFQ